MHTKTRTEQGGALVAAWRRDQLVVAGFALPDARRLAHDQRYDLHTFLEQGERAAVQFTWSGRCAIDLGPLPGGTRLTAHIAAFYEFEHGLVKRQSSYDCYEPIAPTGVVTAT